MSGFDIFIGVAAYSAAKYIVSVVLILLFLWSIYGLYKDRISIHTELTRLKVTKDNTPVSILGHKAVIATLIKLFLFGILFIFATSGIVKLVEADETVNARKSLSLPQQLTRSSVEIPTASELRVKRAEKKSAAKKLQQEIDEADVALQKSKSDKAIALSFENQK
jgi:hypothetical protein